MITNKNKGISLIEVVIGSAIVLLIFSGLMTVFNFYFKHSVNLTDNIKAEFLAEEGLEALRTMRDASYASVWDNIGPEMYLEWKNNTWTSTTTMEVIDNIFYRNFKLEEVYRDGVTYDIEEAGELDADTIKATVNVSWWENNATSTRSLSTYFGNVFEI